MVGNILTTLTLLSLRLASLSSCGQSANPIANPTTLASPATAVAPIVAVVTTPREHGDDESALYEQRVVSKHDKPVLSKHIFPSFGQKRNVH